MTNMMNQSTVYHIYPLGFCGAPQWNDFNTPPVNRLKKVEDWLPHIQELGCDTIYFGPLFESTEHGYDTADYYHADRRLCSDHELKEICRKIKDAGLKIILDGVFNHVGRDFWAFRDVREKKQDSHYTGWFHLNFGENSNYDDGFAYAGWEGHYNLVKLNLQNPEVRDHVFGAIRTWKQELGIDGLRLDVAYSLDHGFLQDLHHLCAGFEGDFWLMGETLHGDYNTWVNDRMLDSCTNYECYKGLHSSFNDRNFFEIGYSLNRQFGSENWCIYRGKQLYNFVDNHDVSRIASILKDDKDLENIYTLLFTMPGVPSIYYGSEWGVPGDKKEGDGTLRPALKLEEPKPYPGLAAHICGLAGLRRTNPALGQGDYRQLHVQNESFAFSRTYGENCVVTMLNLSNQPCTITVQPPVPGSYVDLFTGQTVEGGSIELTVQPKSAAVLMK